MGKEDLNGCVEMYSEIDYNKKISQPLDYLVYHLYVKQKSMGNLLILLDLKKN